MKTPINIITGFLGVGKTTTLRHILEHRPQGERWAVLVNEFGEVGIDGALLEGAPEGLTIKEVPGGCICCSAGMAFQVAVVELLRNVRPDRLLIEPTGLATVRGILETFELPGLTQATDVRAVITLVDPGHWASPRHRMHETYREQVEAADVLLASRADLGPPEALERLLEDARAMFPPRLHVGEISHGKLDLALLDLEGEAETRRLALEELTPVHDIDVHGHHHHHGEATGLEVEAGGWVFGPEHVFDETQLMSWLGSPPLPEGFLRIKGVFRTTGGWLAVNGTPEFASVRPSSHRRDSRLEVLAPGSPRWDRVEETLRACLVV